MHLVSEDVKQIRITEKELKDYLGAPRYYPERQALEERVGVVNGLAWTSVGGELLEVVQRYAEDYPDVKFVGFDIDPTKEAGHPNVFCLTYAQNEGDFLAGAWRPKSPRPAPSAWLRAPTPSRSTTYHRLRAGSLQANPSGKVAHSFIGSYTDTAKAKELALVQINQSKADIIHQVAGGAGLGVFEACKGQGPLGIGVDATSASSSSTPSRRSPTSSSPL